MTIPWPYEQIKQAINIIKKGGEKEKERLKLHTITYVYLSHIKYKVEAASKSNGKKVCAYLILASLAYTSFYKKKFIRK